MTRQLVGHHQRALVDVEVPRAESEGCNGNVGDLPRGCPLQRAAERATHAVARHTLRRTAHDRVHEQLDRQLAGAGDHRGSDREWLAHHELIEELLATGELEPAEQGCRGAECGARRTDDRVARVEGEILYPDLDHRCWAARARWYAAAASAGRPIRSSTTPMRLSGRSFPGSSCAAASYELSAE